MANKPKTNATAGGKNYFRVRARIGEDSQGKPVYKNFYGTSKSDAEKKKREYLDTLAQGVNPDLGKQSLNQAMHTWLWEVERYNGNKSSSFERYESIYRNYIKDVQFAMYPVSEIKKILIQKYYNELLFDKSKSISQIKNLHKLLNKFFIYAEYESYITKNPLRGLKLPSPSEEEIEDENSVIETFNTDEIEAIKKIAGHSKIRYIMMFALLTGAREGEILALERADNLEDKVKINKTLRTIKVFDNNSGSKYHYELKTTKPKTKKSNRELPVNETLKSELRALNKLVAEEKLKLGPLYTDNDLLFPSETGTYIDAKNLRRSWERLLKKAGVPQRKFHALRHTFATTLFKQGVDILTVSRLLGHASLKTTEIYTHILEEQKSDALSVLDNVFGQ